MIKKINLKSIVINDVYLNNVGFVRKSLLSLDTRFDNSHDFDVRDVMILLKLKDLVHMSLEFGEEYG